MGGERGQRKGGRKKRTENGEVRENGDGEGAERRGKKKMEREKGR